MRSMPSQPGMRISVTSKCGCFVAHSIAVRMHTVARHADNLKAKTFPVNQLAHQQQDLFFIICQYDP